MKWIGPCLLLLLFQCSPQPEKSSSETATLEEKNTKAISPEAKGDPAASAEEKQAQREPPIVTADLPEPPENEAPEPRHSEGESAEKLTNDSPEMAAEDEIKMSDQVLNDVQADRPKPRGGEIFALLIGINSYRNLTNLNGAVNDVKLMKQLLMEKYEVPEANIETLLDAQATRAAILGHFETFLIEKVGPQDKVVFHFSGHGSQMKDVSNDEPDGLDETLVPHDSRDEGIFDISDDELNAMLKRLAARCRNVTLILDSCHSSSGQKPGNWRKISPDKRMPPATHSQGTGDGSTGGMVGEIDIVELAACGTTEVAGETPAHGEIYGALTYKLVQVLYRAPAGATWQQIMPELIRGVHQNHKGQTPQLSGQRERVIFGASKVAEPTHITVIAATKDEVTLNAGLAHGMTEHSVFKVLDGENGSSSGSLLGRVVVAKVTPFTSAAKVLGNASIPVGAWAIEIEHHSVNPPLGLAFDPNIDKALFQRMKNAMAGVDEVRQVSNTGDADLVIYGDAATKRITLKDRDGIAMGGWLAAQKEAALRKALGAWANWFRIRAIESAVGPQPEVNLLLSKDKAFANHQKGDASLTVGMGDVIYLRVENKSRRDLYPVILMLLSNGQIMDWYPGPIAYQPLAAGETLPLNTGKAKLPEGVEAEKIIFKLILTPEPVAYRHMTQASIGNMGDSDKTGTVASRAGRQLPAAFSVIQKTVTIRRHMNQN